MKKKMASLLACALIFSAFAGCGDSTGSNSVVNDESRNTPDEHSEAAEVTVDRSNFKIRLFDTSPTIEETVLVDKKGVKITATGLKYDNYEAELGLKIENATETEIDVSGNGAMIVNNFTIPAWISYDVPANETIEDAVGIDMDELKLRGIYEIANMGLHLTIEDDDYNKLTESNVIIPTSIGDAYVADDMSYQNSITDPQTADQYGYEVINWDTDTIFDQYGVQFTSVALLKNSDDERYMLIEIVNTNDVAITVSLRNMSIAGKTVVDGTISGVDIFEQSRGVITVKLDRDIQYYLEDNSLVESTYFNDFSEINLELNVYTDQDTIIHDEPLTISFT